MGVLDVRTAKILSRLTGAALLLFVFSLPLHFHFASSSQLSSQCSCLHGARTQLALPDDTPIIAPTSAFAIPLAAQSDECNFTAPQGPFVRGPPLSLPV